MYERPKSKSGVIWSEGRAPSHTCTWTVSTVLCGLRESHRCSSAKSVTSVRLQGGTAFGFYKLKTKLHGLSPRANYTDRATAACRRSDCQLLWIEGATWSAWQIPKAVFSVFYTGAATFLSSSSSVVLTRLSGLRFRPTTFFQVLPVIEPRPPICSQELWPLDHRGCRVRLLYMHKTETGLNMPV
jgi:hypothetical protein